MADRRDDMPHEFKECSSCWHPAWCPPTDEERAADRECYLCLGTSFRCICGWARCDGSGGKREDLRASVLARQQPERAS